MGLVAGAKCSGSTQERPPQILLLGRVRHPEPDKDIWSFGATLMVMPVRKTDSSVGSNALAFHALSLE